MTNPSFSETEPKATTPICPSCGMTLYIIYTKTPETMTDYYGFDINSGKYTWNQDSSDVDDDDHGTIHCGYCHCEIVDPLAAKLWSILSDE